jgi:lipopolysaccharide export system protein LptC
MSQASTANRLRLPILIAFAASLALGSVWLLEVIRKDGNQSAPSAVRSAPDYYIEKFDFIRMSESGQPRYQISGAKLVHYPLDNSSEIERPMINRLEKDRPPMNIRADRARLEDDNSKVHMRGHVNVDRPATPMAKYFHLESDYLLALPDEDIVQTDRPVHIVLGDAVLNGTGMYSNNATREFRLSNNVHGTYPPSAH